MEFCPKCHSILIPKKNDKKKLACSKCNYSVKSKGDLTITEKLEKKENKIEVVDKKIDVLPKVKEECPKCSNKDAFFWTLQTRSSDEPETRFFECANQKCKHRWRSYT